ncbi:hypothetical protein [Hymenobacter glacialis]|uniref:hypothetical protein n=1 Tax=Hymenobacter glacialis TaxID=1908236 RepID=UPI000F7BAB38|nr:hypothetical protein [Hymenobacter glacialis]
MTIPLRMLVAPAEGTRPCNCVTTQEDRTVSDYRNSGNFSCCRAYNFMRVHGVLRTTSHARLRPQGYQPAAMRPGLPAKLPGVCRRREPAGPQPTRSGPVDGPA